jgi:dihydrofolate reductase
VHHVFEAGQGAATRRVNDELPAQVPATWVAGGYELARVLIQANAVDFHLVRG